MKGWLKRGLTGLAVVVGILGGSVGIYAAMQSSAFDESMARTYDVAPLPIKRSSDPAIVLRGKHLVDSVGACATRDCHGADFGGGKPIDMGPVALLIGPNVTAAGVAGSYSDGELARLLRHGIKKDGRSVRFMPVQDFGWLPDADLAAVVSYLRTVPAVDRASAPTAIKPLGKVLDRHEKLVLDVARHLASAPRDTAPSPSPTAEYGKFVGRLCTGCHGEQLSGGPIPGAPPSMPVPLNLTPDATGLAGWTEADFTRLLETGVRKNGKKLDPFMPIDAFGKLDDVEKKALWAYVQSLTPRPFGGR